MYAKILRFLFMTLHRSPCLFLRLQGNSNMSWGVDDFKQLETVKKPSLTKVVLCDILQHSACLH